MIAFLCPQGHKIHCPADQAGKPAKCPRCGVRFRIPSPGELPQQPTPQTDSTISAPEMVDSGVRSSSPNLRPRPAEKDAQIEFLCPNGHHLHGPASLQGRPGECPECGSRFRIPTYDEAGTTTPVDEPITLDGAGSAAVPGGLSAAEAAGQEPVELALDIQEILPGGASPSAVAGQGHPLAQLFPRIWAAKGERGRIELRLSGSEILVPDGFVKDLSRQSHGVFVTNDPDRSFTLTVVAWESVTRVLVKGVQQLPPEMRG